MKSIYDRETELGRCDPQSLPDFQPSSEAFGEGECTMVAHTSASLMGRTGMLRIEHRCFFRRGGEIPDEPCMTPDVALEPSAGGEKEIDKLVTQSHLDFIGRVRQQFSVEPVLSR